MTNLLEQAKILREEEIRAKKRQKDSEAEEHRKQVEYDLSILRPMVSAILQELEKLNGEKGKFGTFRMVRQGNADDYGTFASLEVETESEFHLVGVFISKLQRYHYDADDGYPEESGSYPLVRAEMHPPCRYSVPKTNQSGTRWFNHIGHEPDNRFNPEAGKVKDIPDMLTQISRNLGDWI